jgi:chromosome segregation ATPase
MPRISVNYQEVANAIQEILAQRRNPTLESIRALIGRGSHTTIGNHFRAWKANQDPIQQLVTQKQVPQELISLVKGLWDRLIGEAEEKIESVKQETQKEISDLNTELQQSHAENARCHQQFHILSQEKETLTQHHKELNQSYLELQKSSTLLTAKYDYTQEQLQEKQNRIEELHQLHHQTQANLEHYRESVRQQRLIEQEKNDGQQQKLEKNIQLLQEQIAFHAQEKSTLRLQYEKQTFILEQKLMEYEKQADELARLEKRFSDLEGLKIELLTTKNHVETQNRVLEQNSENLNKLNNDLKLEIVTLTQRQTSALLELEELKKQYTFISTEKSRLLEEKGMLEGQIKQMEAIVR